MLSAATGYVRQRRRAALAHQCASCKQFWALHLVHGRGGQLILCRYCGAIRGAHVDEGPRRDVGSLLVSQADR